MSASRIIIVEDDLESSRRLSKLLLKQGYDVGAIERSGEQAIERILENRPDLILMDVLPVGSLDGVAAADQILRQFGIPVILLTDLIDFDLIKRAQFTEISSFLLKPVHEQELYGAIELALAKQKKSHADSVPVQSEILNHLTDAVIVTDSDSCITYMNRAAEQLCGWKNEEASGKILTEVFRTIADESDLLISDVPDQTEKLFLLPRNGPPVPIQSNLICLGSPSRSLKGFMTLFRDVSEQKAMEDALRSSRENLKRLLQSVNGIVWESDLRRETFSYVSDQVGAMLGYSVNEWRNNAGFWAQHLVPEDSAVVRDVDRIFARMRKNYVLKYRMVSADKNVIWIKDTVQVIDENGIPVRLRGVMENITAEKAAEIKFYESQERYRMLVDSAPDVIFSLSSSNGVITMLNPAFEKITGFPVSQWIGKSFISLIHPDDVNMAIALYERTLSGELIPPVEIRFRSRKQEFLYGEITTLPTLKNDQCVSITGIVRDITDRKIAEEKLIRSAFYDALTGLPNRALFIDRLGHAILRSKRKTENVFGVLFIDLDRFKVVNDSLGHRLGDELLVAVARRLEECLRIGDTVARLGGDEFVLLLDHIEVPTDAQKVADRIHQAFSLPFQIGTQEIFATVSIGIAFGSPKYDRPEEILRDADLAMYRAKSLGRARSEIFDAALHSQAITLLQMETDLRRSIERSELQIFYQPILDLRVGRVCSLEALARWKHPERGLIQATDFIHLAEDTGLIHLLGENMLWQSCLQLREWQNNLPYSVGISVNLSCRQFSNPRLLQEIREVLECTKIDPTQLTLEITETVLMENREMAEELIDQLHKLGVKLHVDDFGTGYSSLSYLRRFPIDALKIDKSFIQTLNESSEIVQTILTLARNLNLQAIAEGIENDQQLQHLVALGCSYGQGFLFAKPLPASEIPSLLESLHSLPALHVAGSTA